MKQMVWLVLVTYLHFFTRSREQISILSRFRAFAHGVRQMEKSDFFFFSGIYCTWQREKLKNPILDSPVGLRVTLFSWRRVKLKGPPISIKFLWMDFQPVWTPGIWSGANGLLVHAICDLWRHICDHWSESSNSRMAIVDRVFNPDVRTHKHTCTWYSRRWHSKRYRARVKMHRWL